MVDTTTTEKRAALRNRLAVCECSQRGASGFTDDDGVTRWTCCQCGFRYESPPRVDRKLVLALLDDADTAEKALDDLDARAVASENQLEDRTGERNAAERACDLATARAEAAESRISRAIDYAGGRWSEWGQRALGVIEILEGGNG